MQVILMEDVPSLGKIGDLVKVSEGYGRNYLIPQKKALLATEKNMKVLAHQKRQVQHHVGRLKKDAENLAARINDLSCTFAKACRHWLARANLTACSYNDVICSCRLCSASRRAISESALDWSRSASRKPGCIF